MFICFLCVQPNQFPTAYAYDDANCLTTVTQGSSAVTLTYDATGRCQTLTLPNGVVGTYTYDVASNLKTLTYTKGSATLGDLVYTYDHAGQRVGLSGSLAKTVLPAPVTATPAAAYRPQQFGGKTQAHYPSGDLLSDGTRTYLWNARGQLRFATARGGMRPSGYPERQRGQGLRFPHEP